MNTIKKTENKKYEKRISEVSILYKAALAIVLLVCFDLKFGGSIRRNLSIIYSVIFLMIVGLAVAFQIEYIKTGKFTRYTYVVLLNLAGTYGLTFIVSEPSPFAVFLIILLVQVRKEFNKTTTYFVMAYYSAVIMGSYFYYQYHSGDSLRPLINIIVLLVATFTMYSYLDGYLQISKEENIDLKFETKEAEKERARLESLVNNINDAVFACDGEMQVVVTNPQASKLINAKYSLIGKKLDDILNIKDDEGNNFKISQLSDTTRPVVVYTNYLLHYSDTDYINVYISINKVLAVDTSSLGYVVIMRDITRLKSLEEERNEFISIMSHELRTPVAIVEGSVSMAQSLNGKGQTEKMKTFLGKAHDQIMMLSEIVNGLSTLINNEKNAESIQIKEVDIPQLAAKLVDAYRYQVVEKNLTIDFYSETNIPLIYSSDNYIHEILQNILTNSIKYTKKGGITLSVSSKDPNHVTVEIKDTGIGIGKADLDHIFEKFWRSADFETRENNGTGLGLYLVKKLADGIQVNIKVDSEKGKGTTFNLVFPTITNTII